MRRDPFMHLAELTRIDLTTLDPQLHPLLRSLTEGPAPARVGQLFPFPVAQQLRILPRPYVSRAGAPLAWRWEQLAALTDTPLWPAGTLRRQLEQLRDELLAHNLDVTPHIGQLDSETTQALADIVHLHTPATGRCYFYILGSSMLGPDLAYLYRGPAAAVSRLVPAGQTGPWQETPAMWWAEDGSWCCITPQDSPSTYLGGSAALTQAVLHDPRIEAHRATPGDAVDDWLAR